MPTLAQINKWRAMRAAGKSYRFIANTSRPRSNVAAVYRACQTPETKAERAKRMVDLATLSKCRGIAANIKDLHYESYQRLHQVHRDMLAADVTTVINETRREVLKALGY